MKPEFAKFLQLDSILLLEGNTKKKVLEEIIEHAATRCTMDEDQLREAIWKREKMMTTGVGKGLALPHIRVTGFPSPLVIVGICKNPVEDYKSLDQQPITLIVFLAADERDQEAYLKLLGSISSKMKEGNVMQEVLANSTDKKKIYEILSK